jgi:hypothetical protein
MSTKVKAHTIAHDILTSIHKFVITVPASKDGNYGQFYLQVSIALETSNPRAVKDFEKLKPIIQASVIGDVMQRGPALEGNPIALKKLISASALRAANRVLAQADSKVGNSPFFGAYVTSYINQ